VLIGEGELEEEQVVVSRISCFHVNYLQCDPMYVIHSFQTCYVISYNLRFKWLSIIR